MSHHFASVPVRSYQHPPHALWALATAASAALVFALTQLPQTLHGPATVHDGDTIYVLGTPVRIEGIDAPELSEPAGDRSRRVMQEIIGVGTVTCTSRGQHSYKRIVAVCRRDRDHVDIGAQMVIRGAALDCAHYSGGRYSDLEPAGIRAVLPAKPYC